MAPDSAPQSRHWEEPGTCGAALVPEREPSRWYHDPVRPPDERGLVAFPGQRAPAGSGARRHTWRRRKMPRGCPRPRSSSTRSTSAELAADVFAPDGAGSTADRALEPVVIIQPPPERDRQPAPRARAAHDGRGPDDPPRRGCWAGRRCSCPAWTTPSIAAQFVLDGIPGQGRARAARRPGSRAVPRADGHVDRGDAERDPRAAAPRWAGRATGAGCGSRWTRSAPAPSARRSCGSSSGAWPIGPSALVNEVAGTAG